MRKNIFISFLTTFIFFIILNILFINEDSSFFPIIIFLSLILFFVSLATRKISQKIINFAKERISHKIVKVLYYVFLPIIILILNIASYWIIRILINFMIGISDLGVAVVIIFTMISFWVTLATFVPYVQALVMLLTDYILKKKK